MGFFTNTGALNEGEIILSKDRRHLYQVTKDKLIECEKIIVPPDNRLSADNQDLWSSGQKRGVLQYDSMKKVMYKYNIDSNAWDEYDISLDNAFDMLLKLHEEINTINSLPKNAI